MAIYSRVCPKCGVILVYKSANSFYRARSKNSLCRRCTLKDRVFSEETKLKIRESCPDRRGDKNPNFGKVSVLKGKKWSDFRSEESIRIGKDLLKDGLFSGHKHTDDAKNKQSLATSMRNKIDNPAKQDNVKQKLRDKTIAFLQSGGLMKKTSIEQELESLLIKNNIEFEYQYKYGFYLFDFYLNKYDIFIECDGDYYHANPMFYSVDNLNATQKNNVKRGNSKDTFMKNKGKLLLRFWEYDIKNNINEVETIILKTLINK